MANNSQVLQEVDKFLKTALRYVGKEIGLQSGQYFGIDQIRNEEKEQNNIYGYKIQYGFPQSGCVCLTVDYIPKEKQLEITELEVYAPDAGQDMTIANFAPKTQVAEIGISMNFGMNNGSKPHTGLEEIGRNPNALKMLELATSDLAHAQVLGECCLCVPEGSDYIPCCNSTQISDNRDFPRK